MRKKLTAVFFALGLIAITSITTMSPINAEEAGAGSSQDPVVTKSYVDRLIQELPIMQKVKAQEEIIGVLNSQIHALQNSVESLKTGGTGDNIYEAIQVQAGQKLIGKQGSEIILRSGEGKAISSAGGGLQDMTQGKDIMEGFVPKYHLLIIPREDGRGVLVTKTAVFMVRGGYTIE